MTALDKDVKKKAMVFWEKDEVADIVEVSKFYTSKHWTVVTCFAKEWESKMCFFHFPLCNRNHGLQVPVRYKIKRLICFKKR